METSWYTGTGDDGYTSVLGRERVPKYAGRPKPTGLWTRPRQPWGGPGAGQGDPHARAVVGGPARSVLPDGRPATLPETAIRPPWLTSSRLDWLEICTEELGATIQMPRAFIVRGIARPARAGGCPHRCPPRREAGGQADHDGEVRDDMPSST